MLFFAFLPEVCIDKIRYVWYSLRQYFRRPEQHQAAIAGAVLLSDKKDLVGLAKARRNKEDMAIIESGSPPLEVAPAMPVIVDVESVDEASRMFGPHWEPDYTAYTRPEEGHALMARKFHDVAAFLKTEGTVSAAQVDRDLETSLMTVDHFYAGWTSGEKTQDGTFAFMVPTRAERENGFAPEFRPFYPLVEHVGSQLGQLTLVGTPPFIIDRYEEGPDGSGKRGMMLFAPVFGDMVTDVPGDQLEATFNRAIQDAVEFARDRGVTSVGLGAILPAVTNFGKSIDVEGVKTTTGHGGTIHLINETIAEAARSGRIDPDISKIGVVGLGSIGASVADVMAAEYPDADLVLCDTAERKIARTVRNLNLPESRIQTTTDALELLAMKDCKVVVCATTTPVRIPERLSGMDGTVDRFIVDDSQPTAVNPEEARKNAGARVAWPIGKSSDSRLHRISFDYGDLGPMNTDVWGCEAEAFAAWVDPSIALRGPVNPESARQVAAVSRQLGISAAKLQCYGQPIR